MTAVDERLASPSFAYLLWALAVAFFVVGDLITTGIGVSSGRIAEVGPLGDPIVSRYGFPGMVALKFAVIGLSYLTWRLVPDPERVGIPLGLLFVGALVTVWNAIVLVVASGSA
ncbi:hypothetical protein EXE51_05855 [Halorubrum sp. CGM5_25_10-8B]|uniref:hypothetical protein n=1 Tax=Halorubrum sp. CGM5_25_10-8B TaxID=2518115 RepID=UPI0010F87EB8|nr:hypothetical protein [Halorubrum sp. CGM5_25_10-8B]TKX37623.1 hypothetical protein EXE51_05855 [Halorubrum sp. CGM5_25_10-8B]